MALQGSFLIAKVNPISIQQIEIIQDEQFRAWTQFLNEHSLIRYALVTRVQLNHDALRELYCSAVNTSGQDGCAITYRLFGRSIRVTERDVNRIFPMENLVYDPTPEQIEMFFRFIRYQDGNFNTGNLSRTFLTQYWNFFFHTLNHVFSSDRTNQDRIPEFIQIIGYAVANNLRINFGKIVLGQIILKMKHLGTRDVQTQNVKCLYPRFLQLILNDFLNDIDRVRLENGQKVECSSMKTNVINYISKKKYTDVPTVLTEYLKTVPLPLLPRPVRAGIRQGNISIPAIPTSVFPIVSQEIQFLQPPVAILPDQEQEIPPTLTQVEEPILQMQTQTQQTPTPQLSLKRPVIHIIEGDSASAAPHKELVTSAALPHSKRSKPHEPEVTATVSKTILPYPMSENVNEAELTGATILSSISRNIRVVDDLSKDQMPSQASEVELPTSITAGESSILRKDPSVGGSFMNQMPSQASEGNLGFVPFNRFKFNLPEGKSLDLFRDLPLFTSGRQLASREDGSSRTFIAPSVTSEKGARMISFAGTHLGGSSGGELRETRTEHVSVTQTTKPSEYRVLSETPAERTSEQPTQPHAPVTRKEYSRLLTRVQTMEKELSNICKSIAEIKNLQLIQHDAFQVQLSSMAAQFSHAINSLVKSSTPNLPTPHPTTLEDNPTEGEKVDDQEKSTRRKGKEKVVDTELTLSWERKS